MRIQQKAHKNFLRRLFEIKAFEEHVGTGKKLASHQVDPNAPLSTFFFNLRTPLSPGEKKGPLGVSEVATIGSEIFQAALSEGMTFDAIAGIPHAGDPFASEVAKAYEKTLKKKPKMVRLEKSASDEGKTRMSVVEHDRPKSDQKKRLRVLLVDDLITSATTKWIAIDALRRVKYEVAGIVVFIDRGQGGSTELISSGIPFASAFKARDIIKFYQDDGLISPQNAAAHFDYLTRMKG